nr:hypothetical protein BaRGS_022718 [Batillaria attramentaria]
METVLGMDIPKEVAQLAVDIHYLHHHEDFPNAQQLYLAALDIMNDPSKQERYTRELALAREKQPAEETRNAHNKPIQSDLQEDGCGGIDSGLRLPDEVDNAKEVAAATLEPETGQKPEDVPDTKAKLRQRVQKLEKENHKLQHRKLCRMCRKVELATSGITFLPCGHFITCEDCAEKCDDCPACGKNIMGTVRTFLS